MPLLNTAVINELICEELKSESLVQTFDGSTLLSAIARHCQCEITCCCLGGRSTPQSEPKQGVGREKGGGLGSEAQTRQLNAPWA